MSHVTSSPVRVGWVASVVIYALVAVGLAWMAGDTAVGWLIPMALMGGALMAGLIVATRSQDHSSPLASGGLVRDGVSGEVMNIARVRVAGVGGVGLLFVAGLVALQYQLTAVALGAGAMGGMLAAGVVILHRRRHGLFPSVKPIFTRP